jgi:hypothetical protein
VKIQIGELFFATKVQAIEHFRAKLFRYEAGDAVSEDDTRELLWLLARHPSADQKRGAGVLGFSVEELSTGVRRFRIVRQDMSSTDFSFRKCIDKPPPPLSRISAALRIEVRDEILAAKPAYFEAHGDAEGRVPCQQTGALVKIDEGDADHARPYTFHVLVTTFLGALSLTATEVLLEPLEDNQYGRPCAIVNSLLAGEDSITSTLICESSASSSTAHAHRKTEGERLIGN